jgi:hypothetical protein
MVGETVITNNKAVNKDAPKSTARRLKESGVSFCLKRFERSEAVERLERSWLVFTRRGRVENDNSHAASTFLKGEIFN